MEQTKAEEARDDVAEHKKESSEFSPRGTFIFLLLMLLGYAGYWAYLWVIIALRAGGV